MTRTMAVHAEGASANSIFVPEASGNTSIYRMLSPRETMEAGVNTVLNLWREHGARAVFNLWRDHGQNTALASFGEVGICISDSVTGSWWNLRKLPGCFTDWDDYLWEKAGNIATGALDLAQITASVAFMCFLLYMLKPKEKDSHNDVFVYYPATEQSTRTLEEAIAEKGHLLRSAFGWMEPVDPNDVPEEDRVEIPPAIHGNEERGSFWILKSDYNRIARANHFHEAKS